MCLFGGCGGRVCLVPGPLQSGWGGYARYTPLWKVHSPEGTPSWCWHLVVATEASGTHPTGMISCFLTCSLQSCVKGSSVGGSKMILTREVRGHQAVEVLIISETRREVFVRTGSYWRSLDTHDRKFQWSLSYWPNLEYELCNFIVVQTCRGRFNEGGCFFFIVSVTNVWIYFVNNLTVFLYSHVPFFLLSNIVIFLIPLFARFRICRVYFVHG